MRVHFEFTEEDLKNAHRQLNMHAKVARHFYWQQYVAAYLASALALFMVVKGSMEDRLSLALLSAALFTLFHPAILRFLNRGAERTLYRKALGPDTPALCEVELRGEGVWCRQACVQQVFEWSVVDGIREMSGSVDITTTHGNGVVVQNRAFAAPEERRAFIERANALRDASRANAVAPASSRG